MMSTNTVPSPPMLPTHDPSHSTNAASVIISMDQSHGNFFENYDM